MTPADQSSDTSLPEVLKQEGCLREFLNDDGQWTEVYLWEGIEGRGLYAAFTPVKLRTNVLQEPEWDSGLGDGQPYFFVDSNDHIQYNRHSYRRHEALPIIIKQDNHGIGNQPLPEIAEEFRHLMDLLPNRDHTEYRRVLADGTVEIAAHVSRNHVKLLTKYLRRYQAAKQIDLVLYIDSRASAPGDHTASFAQTYGGDTREIVGDDHRFRMWSSYFPSSTTTTLMGKKIIPPPPQERSGIFPWDEDEPEEYLEFQIGEDELGDPIMYTCDPHQVADYFGANPEAPQYVTPVWFRGDVLQKYFSDNEKYTVTDGRLSCGDLWCVRIDNDNEHGDVMVLLGDLGRDIPSSERYHWKAHNIFRSEWGSSTAFRRGILGEWADTESAVFIFKQEYGRFREAWRDRFGWDLFRDLTEKNRRSLDRLRTPLNDSDREFEDIVQDLHIVLVEALNQKELKLIAPDDTNNKRSIALLREYLKDQSYAYCDRDIRLLQRLNEIRNKISHFRSREDERQLHALGISGDRVVAMQELFRNATTMLQSLRQVLDEFGRD